jgi:DNA-binding transcriptional MerR regulator
MTTTAETQEREYTIDELAAAAGVPSRTIRFYQSRGALMAPQKRGRIAYYGKVHLERLKLIAQLQDRGLRIDAIGDLLASIDRGEVDLAEWLGVEQQIQAPWTSDRARTMTEDELYELCGTRRLGLLADLLRLHMVERHGDVYFVTSPALVSIAMRLEAAGIDLETTSAASDIIRKRIGQAASQIVHLFLDRADAGRIDPHDLAKLDSLQPLGLEAVRVAFGRAMENELRELFASGRITKVPVRSHRARKGRR